MSQFKFKTNVNILTLTEINEKDEKELEKNSTEAKGNS